MSLACLCADPRCDAAGSAFDDAVPAYQESRETCVCGGRVDSIGELNTLVERTEFMKCRKCGRPSEKTTAVLT